jgi:predicted RNA-binding Zn-ribbon protein involved in translation (DUF1610 family)
MVRGGKRDGSGRRSTWKHCKTRLIRVPEEFVDQVLDFARKLDNGESVTTELVKEVASSSQLSLLSGEHSLSITCPKCGSSQLQKDGRVKDGRQKYACKTCRHKFAPR